MNFRQRDSFSGRLADGLGWLSIGVGVAEIAAPRAVERLIGVRDHAPRRKTLRAYGLREIAAGVGILTRKRRGQWLWGRVAGDALDLTVLGSAYGERGSRKGRLAIATASVLGVTALDVMCARQLTEDSTQRRRARVTRSIIIDRPAEEIYRFYRDVSNVPRFMNFVEAAESRGPRQSHWRAKFPGGATLEWDSEVTEDRPGQLISWRSESSRFPHSGTVYFEAATGGRGTLVRVEMQFHRPGVLAGGRLAKAFGIPELLMENNLRRLKQIFETGEVVRSDSSIHTGMHAAQPPERVPELVGAQA